MLNKTNFHYPAMLRVAGKNCVIIGGGAVAARKLATLLDAEANVTVVAPLFCDEVQKLASAQGCTLIKDYYKPEYLQNAFVVIAATDNKAVNRQISEAAPCLVNNITEPELSNFTVPSAISEGDITIALATGGMPAFTRLLKKQLEHILTPELADFNSFLLLQREAVKNIESTPQERTQFWRSVLKQDLLNLVIAGKAAQAKEKVLDAVNSLGLNHRTAPVEIRERFNFSNDRVASILRRLRNYDNIPEAMLLSTCNRTELYMVIENPHEAIPFIKSLLKHLAGEHYQSEYFYNLNGTNCVKHLFRVASSLDSLIVGEGQILSQIKNAYHIARINGMTDTILNTIMNKAIAVGKRVRTETKIAYSSVSVSSAAVDLAIKILGDLSKAQILVVGAGHMSELTAQHLLDKGAQTICVSNRHYERAQDLADKFHGTAIPYRAMFEHAADADIIITSTGAPHYVLTAENLGPLLPKRNGRPLILIDIAVPRDVDPRLADVDGVTIYNIDDLEGVVDTNKNFREKEAHVAEQIISEEIGALKERLRYYTMRPVMVQLHDKMNFLRQKVLKKAFIKMPELTDHEKRIIDLMTQRLEHKFLREPMKAMNAVAGTAEEERYKKMMCDLFLLNETGEEFGDESKIDDWD